MHKIVRASEGNLAVQAILLDADGVLVVPPKKFSEFYSDKYKVDFNNLLPFFSSDEFKACCRGELDLKEAIRTHQDKWQWHGDPAELISEWLQAENYPNQELLALLPKARAAGIKVYLACQQEKYRAEFLKNVMFKDAMDGFFITCDLGVLKDSGDYWDRVLKDLGKEIAGLNVAQVLYFDDSQGLVDLAARKGISAHVYTELEGVTRRLG